MQPRSLPKRRMYIKLGSFLKDARDKLCDSHTRKPPSVADMANKLAVSKSFVYQVEKGTRKPKDGDMGKWASVYGISYVKLWKQLVHIPFDLVATFKEDVKIAPADPFSQLTEDEKAQLLPFLEYARWKITHQTSKAKSQKSR